MVVVLAEDTLGESMQSMDWEKVTATKQTIKPLFVWISIEAHPQGVK